MNKLDTLVKLGNEAFIRYGNRTVNMAQLKECAKALNVTIPGMLWKTYKVSTGKWKLPEAGESGEKVELAKGPVQPNLAGLQTKGAAVIDPKVDGLSYIPAADKNYVPWGHFQDIEKVFSAKVFFPIFVTGLSGNGKTTSIIEAAAAAGRELIRVNFTIETDEDDLLGGFRLVNGETAWHDGPVITAMKRGAVLLLDEIDLASHKVMCLQPVCEGRGIFLKKISKMVTPAPGFTIVATANTKGRGSDDGRFVGTNVLNEALLDRFAATFQQPYAPKATETKIVKKMAAGLNLTGYDAFLTQLTEWAEQNRKTFEEGGIDDVISTRRLIDGIKSLAIFGDKERAINMITERFDDETKLALRTLWKALTKEEVKQGIKEDKKVTGKASDKQYGDISEIPF